MRVLNIGFAMLAMTGVTAGTAMGQDRGHAFSGKPLVQTVAFIDIVDYTPPANEAPPAPPPQAMQMLPRNLPVAPRGLPAPAPVDNYSYPAATPDGEAVLGNPTTSCGHQLNCHQPACGCTNHVGVGPVCGCGGPNKCCKPGLLDWLKPALCGPKPVGCCHAKPSCGCAAKPSCCCPVKPSCCCPVKPSCGCHVKPSCCCPAKPSCGCHVKPSCCCPAKPSCCAPTCGFDNGVVTVDNGTVDNGSLSDVSDPIRGESTPRFRPLREADPMAVPPPPVPSSKQYYKTGNSTFGFQVRDDRTRG